MALNNMDFVHERRFHRTDDLSSPNIVTVLKSRETGIGPVRHMKCAAEFKTALSVFDEKTFRLPRGARLTFLVVLSDDCSRIASAYADNSIYVCNVNNGEIIRRLVGHERSPWCLRFHPHYNDVFASGSVYGEVRVWNIQDGSSQFWNVGKGKAINALAFHPSEHLLIIATANTLYSWDWNTTPNPNVYRSTRTEREYIRYLTFDIYGRLIIGVVNDHSGKTKFQCYTSCSIDLSKDKRLYEAVDKLYNRFKSPLEAILLDPALHTSSSGELTPLARFISEDEATSSASSENRSHSGGPAVSNPHEIEVHASTSEQRDFNWDLDEDGLRPPIFRSPSPLDNTARNVLDLSFDFPNARHRIQCFNFPCKVIPLIDNETENVVARDCTILNDSSVDVSKDGQKLVVLIGERDFKVGVYSLNKNSLGNLLCTWNYLSNAASVSFSPLGSFVVVGTTYPDPLYGVPTRNSVAHVIKIGCVNGQYNAKRIRKFVRTVMYPNLDNFNMHYIKWLTSPEFGLVYCTSSGAVTICKPMASKISLGNLGSPPTNITKYVHRKRYQES